MIDCTKKLASFMLISTICIALSVDGMELDSGMPSVQLNSKSSCEDSLILKRFPVETRRYIPLSLSSTGQYNFEFEETLCNHVHSIEGALFSPSGTTLLTKDADMMIRIWDIESGKVPTTLENNSTPVHVVAYHPNENIAITSGAHDKAIRLWNTLTGSLVALLTTPHKRAVYALDCSPDGKSLLAGSADKTASLWDIETNTMVQAFEGHEDRIESATYSSSTPTVLTAGGDKTIRLWDLRTAKEIMKFEGHTNCVIAALESFDGETIVSGSSDGTARLWSIKTGGIQMPPLEGHKTALSGVLFSPGTTHIITGSWDKTICLWDAHTGKKLMKVESHEIHSEEPLAETQASALWGTTFLRELNRTLKNMHPSVTFIVGNGQC